MVSIARLSVAKQSSFGLPGQYGRRVTRVKLPNMLLETARHSGRKCTGHCVSKHKTLNEIHEITPEITNYYAVLKCSKLKISPIQLE